MTRPIDQPLKPWQPPESIEYLPKRLQCPDGRLRMVGVAHRWRNGSYVPAPDVCGRLPARATSYQGARNVAGFCADGRFYPREEE